MPPRCKKSKLTPTEPTRVRYWCLDSRTGQAVLDTALENKSRVEYTLERNLTKSWVELRLGETIHRFSYAVPEAESQSNREAAPP